DRTLTCRGRRDAERVGRELARRGVAPDLALSSGARRADETMNLVLNQTRADPSRMVAPELYEADADTLVRWLRRSGGRARTILIVGHNPSIEALAMLIHGGDYGSRARLSVGFPPGGLAVGEIKAGDWGGFQPKRASPRALLLHEPPSYANCALQINPTWWGERLRHRASWERRCKSLEYTR